MTDTDEGLRKLTRQLFGRDEPDKIPRGNVVAAEGNNPDPGGFTFDERIRDLTGRFKNYGGRDVATPRHRLGFHPPGEQFETFSALDKCSSSGIERLIVMDRIDHIPADSSLATDHHEAGIAGAANIMHIVTH